MNFFRRLVAIRAAVPSEVDGSLSCFYCNQPFYSSTDEDDVAKHQEDCLYVEAVKALARGTEANAGCALHGSAHPCEECAADMHIEQERDDLLKALREARALLDHAGCPVGWIDKVLAGSAATGGVPVPAGQAFPGKTPMVPPFLKSKE